MGRMTHTGNDALSFRGALYQGSGAQWGVLAQDGEGPGGQEQAPGAFRVLDLATPERPATWPGSSPPLPPPHGWPGKNRAGQCQSPGLFSVHLRKPESILMF